MVPCIKLIKYYTHTQFYLEAVVVLTGLSRGTVLSSDKGTVPKEPPVVAGTLGCC